MRRTKLGIRLSHSSHEFKNILQAKPNFLPKQATSWKIHKNVKCKNKSAVQCALCNCRIEISIQSYLQKMLATVIFVFK